FTYASPSALSTLSLHDALPIWLVRHARRGAHRHRVGRHAALRVPGRRAGAHAAGDAVDAGGVDSLAAARRLARAGRESLSAEGIDRKSTRLNSSHVKISYAVFC